MNIIPDIHISFKYIAYSEGSKVLELDFDRGDSDAYLYVPNDQDWNTTFNGRKAENQKSLNLFLGR